MSVTGKTDGDSEEPHLLLAEDCRGIEDQYDARYHGADDERVPPSPSRHGR